MARPEKVAQVDAVTAIFSEAGSVVLNDFTGLDVAKVSELRRRCREAGVSFRVVKNTLAKRGIADTPASELASFFEGPTAVAYTQAAENAPAKVLAQFAAEHERPKFKAGFFDGRVITGAQVATLSKLPSRDQLLAQVLGGLRAPGNGLVACLQGPLRNLMSVLDQIKNLKA
ncbi:MAG: 50S ribosomal protein L10 [Candidatus Krumholzibacteria bacterium]|nr:50S ribosomal protein L10 [Candidatus Krumholzibacteria bacterium]